MMKFIIPAVLIYLFLENYSITVETTNNDFNKLIGLPKQVPIKDIIFKSGDNNNSLDQLLKIYISRSNESLKLF